MNLSDRDILAKTIMAEAGNQSQLGMLGVGSVIMNRLRNPGYGSTLQDVTLKPGQFSPWNSYTGYAGGAQGQDMMKLQPSQMAYAVADQILDGSYKDPTNGALNFYNPALSNPRWGKSAGGNWMQIGDHLFGTAGSKSTKDKTMSQNSNMPLNASPLLGPLNAGNPQAAAAKANAAMKKPKARGLFDILGNAVGGSFAGLKGALDGSDPDKSDKLAIALMSLSGNPQQLQPLMTMAANDIQERKKTRGQNKTIEYLRSVDPELAKMAEQNPSMVGNIMSALASKKLSGKGGDLVTAAQLREMFPGQEIKDGLYNLKYENGKVVGATKVGGGGINMPGELDPFTKKSMEKIAGDFSDMSKQGMSARTALGQVKMLDRLLSETETGFGAGLKQFAFDTFGIDVRDDAAIAANAIISQLVPQQRPPGTGPMSDADLALFKNSLPSIASRPGGNQIIIETMKSIAQYQYDVGQIANKALTNKDYTPEMAYADMSKLPDPLARAFAYMDAQGLGEGGSGQPGEMSEAEKEAYRTLGIPIPGE